MVQYQIYQLDKVQRSAAYFILNDFSRFSSMLDHLAILANYRTKEENVFTLLMLFKLIHGLVEVSSITLTPLASCTCGHSRRYTKSVHQLELKHIYILSCSKIME